MKLDVKSPTGTGAGTVDVPDELFGIEPNTAVMHQVVTAQLAAARAGTHSTKTRAEVAGGGAKPWRQKGTGRARAGTTRAPQWTGGGVVFGPHPRSYVAKVNRKARLKALRIALSAHVTSGSMVFGPVERPGAAHEYAEAGQEIWFRLEPGPHAFALVPENGFSATWRAARGEVSVSVNPGTESEQPVGP